MIIGEQIVWKAGVQKHDTGRTCNIAVWQGIYCGRGPEFLDKEGRDRRFCRTEWCRKDDYDQNADKCPETYQRKDHDQRL